MTPPETSMIGLAAIAGIVYQGADQTQLVHDLTSRREADPRDAAALMDLSILAQLNGDRERGLSLQRNALAITRIFTCVHGDGTGLVVLALLAPGDFMANTPLDFLFDGANVTVHYAYPHDAESLSLLAFIEHDVAVLGVAESEPNRPLVERLASTLSAWPRPVINASGSAILELKRDSMWKLFDSCATVAAPRNVSVHREDLARVANGADVIQELLPGDQFPVIVRPVDSHAGHGLAKVDDAESLRVYLGSSEADAFYIAPFVDYSSVDGRFRKYRIVFIAGEPFLAHLAISDSWMVHYLNAGMHDSSEKRAEEADCMARFDDVFGVRQADALRDVAERITLDYFAIDCAELRDGRLLLFEAGTGMIVHALDSAELFPYKRQQMQKIFAAFLELLEVAAIRHSQSSEDLPRLATN